jgi:hypothetical protein
LAAEKETEQEFQIIIKNLTRISAMQAAEFEVQNTFSQILKTDWKSGSANKYSENFARLEKILEEKYTKKGDRLDLWFGAIDDCIFSGNKENFGRITLNYEKKPVLLSSAFIYPKSGSASISKKGLIEVPEAIARFASCQIGFGGDLVLPDGHTKKIILPQGFQ